jgi:hypothetical protein
MVKNSPVGGNFTRVGLGNRVENGIVALGANAASYEIGELVATVSENGLLAANSRLYLVTSNTLTTGSTANFLDVGIPPGYTVDVDDNILFSGQQILATRVYATTNLAVGTTTPDSTMHVVGTGKVTGDLTLLADLVATGSTISAATVTATGTVSGGVITAGAGGGAGTITATGEVSGATITATGTVSGGTITTTGNIDGVNITASGDINTTSDRRVKTNIVPIHNALAKTLQIEGVYYHRVGDATRKVGVIAQDIERILPEVVSGSDLKSVSYGNITGLLIEAIKELNKELQELKSSIK